MKHLFRWLFVVAALGGVSVLISAPTGAQIASTASDPVDGELLVQFRQEATANARQSSRARRRARLLRRFAALNVERLQVPDDVAASVAALRADPDVVAVQPNYRRQSIATGPPNDPYWLSDALWGLQRIMAYSAWTNYSGGNGSVVVADLDTGVNYNHPDLSANIWRNPGEIAGNGVDDDLNGYVDDVYGIDTYNNDSDPMDDNGHGTHTAGTVGASGNNGVGIAGVSWNVKILPCKMLNSAGSGSDAEAVECFNYVVALKNRGVNIRVTTNSWGGLRNGSEPTVLRNAINAAGNAGILAVASAGNTTTNNDQAPYDPASLSSTSIIAVAASDSADGRASFSSYGPTSVDLAAPGVSILSTYGGSYQYLSGTSMAAPHVAGTAALMFMQNPGLSVASAKAALIASVDRLGPWTGFVVSGGRLNVFAALQLVGGAQAPQVSLTAPANNATFTAPATIALSATASDADGTVASVAFYSGSTLIATDAQSPFAVTWSNVAAGTYSLTAVATDNTGASATSTAAQITVSPPQSSASPDGTLVPPAAQIVDSQGDVWTVASSQAILRNGAPAGGGYGSKILWSGGTIYVYSSGTWWKWLGSSWQNAGPTQPGTVVTPPPSTTPSPDGTLVPPAAQIVDSQGDVWTVASSQAILRNGAPAGGGYGSKILWSGGTIYVYSSGTWWKWLGSSWQNAGPTQPGTVVTPPPSTTPSPDGTLVPPAAQIVDSQGDVWTVASSQAILRNGAPAGGGYGSKILWSGGTIYVYSSGTWWKWLGSSWQNAGPTQPGTVVTPPPSTTPSPDGTLVPPAAQIVDSQGDVWTVASSQAILRNGAPAGGGYGSKILWSGGTIYVYSSSTWWKWLGSSWQNVGPTQP